MKLELKHIAPYLPYGLNIDISNYKCDYVGIKRAVANGFYFIGDSFHITYEGGSTGKDISCFKPILRPLSDLSKVKDGISTHNINLLLGDGLENYGDAIFGCYMDYMQMSTRGCNENQRSYIPFSSFEKARDFLFEHHYDVFGLIKQGLAIDINTLTP